MENKPAGFDYTKFDRRKFPRISRTFIVSYSEISDPQLKANISQTKNIGEGGILFTTDRKFEIGSMLKVKIRIPQFSDYVSINAQVVTSGASGKGLMYETRVKFVDIKQEVKDAIKEIVDFGLKEGQ